MSDPTAKEDLDALRARQRAGVKYRVLRNSRLPPDSEFYDVTTVEAEGLSWEDAKALSDRLQREEAEAKPRQTSWTHDIFFPEREDAKKSSVGKKRRKRRPRRRKASSPPPRRPARRTAQLAFTWPN